MLGRAAEEKGWNGLEAPPRPCPQVGVCQGSVEREGRIPGEGPQAAWQARKPPFPNPAMASLPGAWVCA